MNRFNRINVKRTQSVYLAKLGYGRGKQLSDDFLIIGQNIIPSNHVIMNYTLNDCLLRTHTLIYRRK